MVRQSDVNGFRFADIGSATLSVQLRAIAIYSHEGERREVRFALGCLNIVTGGSKTGKSALLDIVDYCWGRGDECTIPRGIIRQSVSWFAVLLDRIAQIDWSRQ